MLSFTHGLAVSYSEMLFMQHAWPGVVMLAVTMLVPPVGVAGLVSVMAAYTYARFIGMGESFLSSGFYTYNALLVGLGLGSLFAITPLGVLLSAIAGVMTFNLSMMMNSLFGYYLKLPILSLPFVLISVVVHLASLRYSNLLLNEGNLFQSLWTPGTLPSILEGFFQSLGAILFMPYPLAGLIFSLVLIWYSRILFLLAVLGFLLGAMVSGTFEGSLTHSFLDINNFNYILIAMALGGVFLVPSRQSLAIVATGVMLASLLKDAVGLFWSTYGLPAFTLPFNMVTLSLLYVLGLVAFPKVADRIQATPEETLDDHISRSMRFPREKRRLTLPFSGPWEVWQGFDGNWTHKGLQAHALDFVMSRNGQTYKDDGLELTDYHAWQKPVLSPARGRISMVHDGVEDNPPGHLNENENWGNWVSIDTGHGWHVIIAHFAQNSIQVKPGDWVEPGARLGRCGNSGYSPQPHIHMHVQISAVPGDATLPFLVQGYLQHPNQFIDAAVPNQGNTVAPLYPAEYLQLSTSMVLDSEWKLATTLSNGRAISSIARIRMNEFAETCMDTGRGRLFFHRDPHQFYFYRLEGEDPTLALLFKFLPRIPLSHAPGLSWKDCLPLSVKAGRLRKGMLNLARVLFPRAGKSLWEGHFSSKTRIEGRILDPKTTLHFRIRLAQDHGLIDKIEAGSLTLTMRATTPPKPGVPGQDNHPT